MSSTSQQGRGKNGNNPEDGNESTKNVVVLDMVVCLLRQGANPNISAHHNRSIPMDFLPLNVLAETDEQARKVVERYYRRPEWEFFDVGNDPWEQTNLVDQPQHAERIEALKRRLAAWMQRQGDKQFVHSEPRTLKDRERWHPDYFQPSETPKRRSPKNKQ